MSTQTSDLYPGGYTVGKMFDHIYRAKTAEQMRAFFAAHVAFLTTQDCCTHDGLDPVMVARENIGYLFGDTMDAAQVALWKETVGAFHGWGIA